MKVAALDLGTNTFLLLVAEVESGRVVRVYHDEARVVRLGQDVDRSRRFHPEALARAKECLKDYSAIIRSQGVESVLGCATSAARDVENRQDLIQIGADCGIPIEVISGEREAELTFVGSLPDDVAGLVQVIDIGGGSMEIVLGDKSGLFTRRSFNIGSVRLTEKFVSRHPIPPHELEKMREFAREELENLGPMYASAQVDPPGLRTIAVAGTATTLAAIDQGLAFESERVHGHRLTLEKLESWIERMAAMTVEERQRLAGMEPKRADVIVAGAVILKEAGLKMGARELEVSVRGLRYGIARSMEGQ